MIRGIAATRKAHGLLLTAALALCSAGCTALTAPATLVTGPVHGIKEQLQYNDEADELITGWRNLVYSQNAWRQHRPQFEAHPYVNDFGYGFRAGYCSVASGGNGCPPPVAPRRYWSWKYQTPEGQAKVAAWFEGFPHGVRAAEEEGIGNWSEIQVSYAVKQEYCDHCKQGVPGPRLVPTPPNGPPQEPSVELIPPQGPGELLMPDATPMAPPGQSPAVPLPDQGVMARPPHDPLPGRAAEPAFRFAASLDDPRQRVEW
jgi:hypothetical protein